MTKRNPDVNAMLHEEEFRELAEKIHVRVDSLEESMDYLITQVQVMTDILRREFSQSRKGIYKKIETTNKMTSKNMREHLTFQRREITGMIRDFMYGE